MSWLKIDDAFVHHEKVLALPRTDRWTWLEVLSYCARNRAAKGRVSVAIRDVVPRATPKFLARCSEVGLLDQNGDGVYHVHDWIIYNGKDPAEKVTAYLADRPDASANDVARDIGGHRQTVLAEVERQRRAGA